MLNRFAPAVQFLLAINVLAGSFLALACVSAVAEPGVDKTKILFGQAAVLEGPAAALGQGMRLGLLAAFAEANRLGGVHQRQLELISLNDDYEPEKSINATQQLINKDKVFALVGAVGTPTALAAQPIAAAAGVPFIGAFTGAEFLRSQFQRDVVNVRASYFQETEAIVDHLIKDRHISRIAILYQDDSFGLAGLAGVQQALARRKMSLVADATFERNTTAVKMALWTIRKAQPEAVIMIGPYRPCTAFIRLAHQLQMKPLFASISFVGSDALAKELGSEGAGVFVSQVVPFPADDSIPFVARYHHALAAFDPTATPGFVSLEGYLVGRLIVAALEKGPEAPTRRALLDTISNNSFDFLGMHLAYHPDDNRGSNTVFLTMVGADGKSKPVKSFAEIPQ
jgi:ABC-type branched-subunit amino acid transport system substrate-binding protein